MGGYPPMIAAVDDSDPVPLDRRSPPTTARSTTPQQILDDLD
jgi:hypothetical protein